MRRVALLLLTVGLAVAGCGSGSKSPSVASLGGSATTTSSSQSQAPPPGGGLSSGKRSGQFAIGMKANLKFSQCMRAHGVNNFPDPNGQGEVTINSSSGLDPRSSTFQSAQKACRKYLPNGGQPTPQQIAKAKQSALAYSECMRAHGVKDFPDPNFSGGGISLKIGGHPGSDLDPNNPTFKQAQTACRGNLFKP